MGNLCSSDGRAQARAVRLARRKARREARHLRRAQRRVARQQKREEFLMAKGARPEEGAAATARARQLTRVPGSPYGTTALRAQQSPRRPFGRRRASAASAADGEADTEDAEAEGDEPGQPRKPERAMSIVSDYYDAGEGAFDLTGFDEAEDWESSGTETEEEPGTGPADAPVVPPSGRNLQSSTFRATFSESALDYDSDDEPRVPMAQRPLAGSSLRPRSVPGPLPECWDEPDATTFQIRGKNYLRDRVKVGSTQAIYTAVAVDAFTSPQRLDHVMRRLRLPEPNLALGPLKPPPGTPSAGVLPRFFVVNIQIPQYEPKLFGHPGNGPGLSVVLVHELVDHGARCSPQLRPLLERFFRNEIESSGEPSRERLKYIPRICNLEEVTQKAGFTRPEKSLMSSYDGKPVLTRPQHRFFRGPGYLEVDLDTHNYSFMARKGMWSYSKFLHLFEFDSAFVLQGNRDEELPEQVLACTRVYMLDNLKNRGPPVPLPSPGPSPQGSPDVVVPPQQQPK